ncbi:unnamed protein product, partial [Mesorhabditis belari]|uniref:MARVEL domain-containing protein n=1 Tax=Mesorhabditis belari TaxID=2138241 RepID=A0AAF3FR89_9BILA
MNHNHSGPPLMVNRGFFEERRNVLRLCQIIVGIFCALSNAYCFPNDLFHECTSYFHSFSQIFSIVCVNVFFCVLTVVMVIFDFFGVTQAYYKYNFHLMERLFSTLATLCYGLSLIFLIVALFQSTFVAQWLFTTSGTLLNTFLYAWDASERFRNDPTRGY